MLPDALTADDQPVWATQFTSEEWDALKVRSQSDPLAFKMPCCQARAILKTSTNGLPFFSHAADECETAPETIWHIEGKDLVYGALQLFGANPKTEVTGGSGKDTWRADVFVEVDDRKIAIELQRSSQHLKDFMTRQARYARHGVECYWLVREAVGLRLMKAIMKKRFREDYNQVFPPADHFINTTPDFFFAILRQGTELNVAAPGYTATHYEWLAHIINNQLHWNGVQWSA